MIPIKVSKLTWLGLGSICVVIFLVGWTVFTPLSSSRPPGVASLSYDGFYFAKMSSKVGLLIHQGKMHGFKKHRLTSMQKLEEYDLAGINEEGALHITATYWKNRKGEIVAKPSKLFDTQVVQSGGKTIALERNGWTYQRIEKLRDLPELLSKDYVSPEEVSALVQKEYKRSIAEIEKAFDAPNFHLLADLHLENLAGDDLEFSALTERIIKALE